MNKQLVLNTLRGALHDAHTMKCKLHVLLRDQGINLIDAPYGLASALERLEQFRDDLRNSLDDIEEEKIYHSFEDAQEALDRGETVRIALPPFRVDPALVQLALDLQGKERLEEWKRLGNVSE